jgi:hypothetical protein
MRTLIIRAVLRGSLARFLAKLDLLVLSELAKKGVANGQAQRVDGCR